MRFVLALALCFLLPCCAAAPSHGRGQERSQLSSSPKSSGSTKAGGFTKPYGFTNQGTATFVDRDGDGLPDTRVEGKPEASLDDATNGLADSRPTVVRSLPAKEPPAAAATDRMLVQRGEIAIEVARPEEAIARCLARVTELGGYLAQQTDTAVTMRVPAAKFETLFADLRGFGRVRMESRTAQDVTEEYVDLGIRLENAKKSRDRLLALLQKADKVEDLLKIEEQLRRLTEEIERMEGRAKFLADQVAMASLLAKFAAPRDAQPERRAKPSRFGWINAIGAERVQEDF
jgi:hypothetical protein